MIAANFHLIDPWEEIPRGLVRLGKKSMILPLSTYHISGVSYMYLHSYLQPARVRVTSRGHLS